MIHLILTIFLWWLNASLIFAVVKATLHFPTFEENR